jgi:hypothetical protein
VLSTLHLNFVNKRQMSRATDKLETFLMKIPHRSRVSRIIKNKNFICDVSTCIFVAGVTAYSKTYSIPTVINILSPFSATVVTIGSFHKISLTVWKSRLIFKHMNSFIEVKLLMWYLRHVNYILCTQTERKFGYICRAMQPKSPAPIDLPCNTKI